MGYIGKSIQLMVTEPEVQKQIINLFRENRINVFENVNEFDPQYPYLFWNGKHLDQSLEANPLSRGRIFCNTVEEFLTHFSLSLTPKEPIYEVY